MGVGFWAKIGQGLKTAGKWFVRKILPIVKTVAPIFGGVIGGPAGAAVGGTIGNIADQIVNFTKPKLQFDHHGGGQFSSTSIKPGSLNFKKVGSSG
jgi:uncharacterized protein (DUF697 family)